MDGGEMKGNYTGKIDNSPHCKCYVHRAMGELDDDSSVPVRASDDARPAATEATLSCDNEGSKAGKNTPVSVVKPKGTNSLCRPV